MSIFSNLVLLLLLLLLLVFFFFFFFFLSCLLFLSLLSSPSGVPAAPTVVCTTRVWHPNIDLHTGLVSLPILTKDWRPVLSINTVVFALQLMFIEPTEQYPVNEVAGTALKTNPDLFREQVRLRVWVFHRAMCTMCAECGKFAVPALQCAGVFEWGEGGSYRPISVARGCLSRWSLG